MDFDWPKMFRRYVYDEEKTPYFVSVGRLNKRQARNEIFLYAFFVSMLFGILGLVALTGKLPHGEAVGVPIYALFTVWLAVTFAWTKNPMAGAACALAPIALAVYLIVFGFPAKLGPVDKVLVGAVIVGWFVYSWRMIRLVARYPDMSEPTEQAKPLRRNPFDMLK